MKEISLRICAGCMQKKHKDKFLRVTKLDNELFIDTCKKAGGRGFYICYDLNCLKNILRNKKLQRVFKTFVDESFYKQLESEILK